jgi:hypothetical protein
MSWKLLNTALGLHANVRDGTGAAGFQFTILRLLHSRRNGTSFCSTFPNRIGVDRVTLPTAILPAATLLSRHIDRFKVLCRRGHGYYWVWASSEKGEDHRPVSCAVY